MTSGQLRSLSNDRYYGKLRSLSDVHYSLIELYGKQRSLSNVCCWLKVTENNEVCRMSAIWRLLLIVDTRDNKSQCPAVAISIHS